MNDFMNHFGSEDDGAPSGDKPKYPPQIFLGIHQAQVVV